MTALEKEVLLEAGSFADNGAFLEAKHEETMVLLRVAGLRRQVDMRESQWELETSGQDGEDSIPLEELQRGLNRAEGELERLRLVNEVRLAASDTVDIPFRELVKQCGLVSFEQETLWLLLFKAVSPDFKEQYERQGLGRYSDHSRDTLCIGDALQILCPGGILSDLDRRRHFATDAPLLRYHLVRLDWASSDLPSILEFQLVVPQRIANWITGDDNQYLSDSPCEVERPTEDLDCVVLPEEALHRVVSVVERHGRGGFGAGSRASRISYGRGLTILEYGPSGTGKTLLARALAHHTGRPLVSMRRLPEGGGSRRGCYQEVDLEELFLEARLQNGILLIDECEKLCGLSSSELPQLLAELERTDGIVIMATNQPQELAPQLDRRFTLKMPFQLPDAAARRQIWELHLNGAELADDVDLGILANDYRLAGGYIKNAALFATNLAAGEADDGAPVIHQAQLVEAAQMQEQHVGGGVDVRRRYRPRRNLGDLLVNASTRTELEGCVRALAGYEEQRRSWGLHDEDGRAGVRLLFYGTEFMTALQSAEAVASELGSQVEYLKLADLAYPDDAKGDQAWTPRQILLAATQVRQVVMIVDEGGWLGEPPEEATGKLPEAIALVRELPGYVIMVSNCRAPRLAREQCFFHREVGFGMPDEACRREAWRRALAGIEAVAAEKAGMLAREHELSMEDLQLVVARAAFEVAASGGGSPGRVLDEVLGEVRTRSGVLFGQGQE